MIFYKDFCITWKSIKTVILMVCLTHVIIGGDFRMAILTAS